MKRILPLCAIVLSLGATAYACKSNSSDDNNTPGGDQAATPGADQPGAPGDTGAGTDPNNPVTAEELNTNPTTDLKPASVILEAGEFTDGPVWHAGAGVLFFTTPLGQGALYRMLPDGSTLKVLDGVSAQGTTPIGATVTANGDLIVVDSKRITRSTIGGDAGAAGAPQVVATGYGTGGSPPPADGGAAIGDGTFDTLNDVVALKNGTLFVTDPGYFGAPIANKIYRVDAQNKVTVVESFTDVPRPNGIALSPDQKSLYVNFSAPQQGTLPFVKKYIVNADGTLGESKKFIDVGPADSSPDGMAVDKAGNLYIATKAGIEVYKGSDGTKWGVIAVPEKPTGMSFGNTDLKTLYITTEGVKIWQVQMKLAGIAQ